MKHGRDCKCPCHQGGVAIHVVPCCDGMPLGLVSKRKEREKAESSPRKIPPSVANSPSPE